MFDKGSTFTIIIMSRACLISPACVDYNSTVELRTQMPNYAGIKPPFTSCLLFLMSHIGNRIAKRGRNIIILIAVHIWRADTWNASGYASSETTSLLLSASNSNSNIQNIHLERGCKFIWCFMKTYISCDQHSLSAKVDFQVS